MCLRITTVQQIPGKQSALAAMVLPGRPAAAGRLEAAVLNTAKPPMLRLPRHPRSISMFPLAALVREQPAPRFKTIQIRRFWRPRTARMAPAQPAGLVALVALALPQTSMAALARMAMPQRGAAGVVVAVLR